MDTEKTNRRDFLYGTAATTAAGAAIAATETATIVTGGVLALEALVKEAHAQEPPKKPL